MRGSTGADIESDRSRYDNDMAIDDIRQSNFVWRYAAGGFTVVHPDLLMRSEKRENTSGRSNNE